MSELTYFIIGIASANMFMILRDYVQNQLDNKFLASIKKEVEEGNQAEVYFKGLCLLELSKDEMTEVIGGLAREMYYYDVPRPIDIMIKPCAGWKIDKMIRGKKEALTGTVHIEPESEGDFQSLLQAQFNKYRSGNG